MQLLFHTVENVLGRLSSERLALLFDDDVTVLLGPGWGSLLPWVLEFLFPDGNFEWGCKVKSYLYPTPPYQRHEKLALRWKRLGMLTHAIGNVIEACKVEQRAHQGPILFAGYWARDWGKMMSFLKALSGRALYGANTRGERWMGSVVHCEEHISLLDCVGVPLCLA